MIAVDRTFLAGQPGRAVAAWGGATSAALALGAGELVAGAVERFVSPVEAVAAQVIDRVPLPVERFAIETFGSNDKPALTVGIVVVSLVVGAVTGVACRLRPWVGPVVMALFAAVGVAATWAKPGAAAPAGLPSLAAGVVGVLALRLLVPPAERPTPSDDQPVVVRRGGVGDRRGFLLLTTAASAGAVFAAAGGRALRNRFSAAQSRAQVVLPRADRHLPPLPAGVSVDVAGVAPFTTPNADFYRVDTALVVPQVRAEDWSLTISGLVDRPYRLSYAELLRRTIVEADITMTCVSNPVGGDLVGNARWLGVLVRDLLADAGVQRGADQLVGRSVDGYTCGFPLAVVDDRDCLVAIGMNGEPLPLRHGFPARLVTPGLYGYIGSTKWLTELEVTTFDAFDQYWVRRGYADRAPVKTMARIDTPRSLERLAPGPVTVAGVAWAQTRGIAAVEVRVDDGPFVAAELADVPGDDTWRQWRFDWDAAPGRHTVTARAVDGAGEVQTDTRRDVVPDGASGWMSLVVLVDDNP